MKKILLFLILLLPTCVFAKMGDLDVIIRFFHNVNQYDSDWNDERLQSAVILDDGSFIVVGGYENTYRPLVPDGPEAFMSIAMRYDKNGKMLWEKPVRLDDWSGIDDCVLLSNGDIIVTGDEVSARIDEDGTIKWVKNYGYWDIDVDSDDYIYAQDYTKLYKLTSDFEVVKEREIADGYEEGVIFSQDGNISFIRRQILDDNNFKTNIYVERVNSDLENVWTYVMAPEGDPSLRINRYILKGATEINGVTYLIGNFDDITFKGVESVGASDSFLLAIDNSGHELWYKITGTKDDDFHEVVLKNFKNDNILIVEEEDRYEDGHAGVMNYFTGAAAFILEYSPNGELIKKEKIYEGSKSMWFNGGISTSKNGIVIVGESYLQSEDYVYENDPDPNGAWYAMILYKTWPTVFKIDTLVNGKGEIEVINNATMGQSITYKVKPKLGYKLESVKVTDVKGKTIEFHDYTFTMPRSDVTIEVNFVPMIIANPETKDFIIIAFGVFIISFIVVMTRYKKYMKRDI